MQDLTPAEEEKLNRSFRLHCGSQKLLVWLMMEHPKTKVTIKGVSHPAGMTYISTQTMFSHCLGVAHRISGLGMNLVLESKGQELGLLVMHP